jgi:hypothetical protein
MERHFQAVRVQPGDYIQPANDRRALYRITRYHEYGDAEYQLPDGRWKKVVGDFWAVYQYERPVEPGNFEVPDDFLHWSCMVQELPTKKAAIEAALSD